MQLGTSTAGTSAAGTSVVKTSRGATSVGATSRGATSVVPRGASLEGRPSFVSGDERTSVFGGASAAPFGVDPSLASDGKDTSDDASRAAAPKPSKS
jgi:hypothetical protein